MKPTMTWLLAGAAFSLCTGASVAFAQSDPADAARQAREDAQSARADALAAQQDARAAREDARRERAERSEQREIRVYRGGDDGDRDVVVIRGGREDTLSDLLQLRPDQQPALKAYLEATRPDHDHGYDHMVRFNRGVDDRTTTLQRLDEMQAKAAEQRAEMDRKIAAIKRFYAQLDAPQKKAFDAMPMLMMVGPNIGPMMIPRPMPIAHRVPPVPPVPPIPPVPPPS